MSENVERRLLSVLDNPTTSPYGNPIPGLAELGVEPPEAMGEAARLSDLPQGEAVPVIVRRLSEHAQSDTELIAALREAGVVPNARVTVTCTPQKVEISTPGHAGLTLSPEMAHSLFVEKV